MRSSLFTVISFPLTIPVLWISINLTASSLEGGSVDLLNLLFLLAFSGVIVSFSYLLFKFIWMEQ
jgi:ABC-type transport system involved in cytochrome c biogenesis permease component